MSYIDDDRTLGQIRPPALLVERSAGMAHTDLTSQTHRPLTVDDIHAGYSNPEWCGVGYLSTRNHALSSTDPECPAQPERVAQADARVIAEANQRGWTAADLFEWLNSKYGRWFGDVWFGGADDEDTERLTPGLMIVPEDGGLS